MTIGERAGVAFPANGKSRCGRRRSDSARARNTDIIPREPVVMRISLVWRASIRDASIFAWLFCGRDKLCDVFVWRAFGVVDPCVPSIGWAGQARKNWGTILNGGKRIFGAPRALTLWKRKHALGPIGWSVRRSLARATEISTPGLLRWDPCKIRRLDRRINFAFPYCYFGLFSCKKSFA